MSNISLYEETNKDLKEILYKLKEINEISKIVIGLMLSHWRVPLSSFKSKVQEILFKLKDKGEFELPISLSILLRKHHFTVPENLKFTIIDGMYDFNTIKKFSNLTFKSNEEIEQFNFKGIQQIIKDLEVAGEVEEKVLHKSDKLIVSIVEDREQNSIQKLIMETKGREYISPIKSDNESCRLGHVCKTCSNYRDNIKF